MSNYNITNLNMDNNGNMTLGNIGSQNNVFNPAEQNNAVKNKKERGNDMPDNKSIFVVHGRNMDIRNAMFTFLRAIGLAPIEWDEAKGMTGKPMPYVSDILQTAFHSAGAVIVLLTPDDEAKLADKWIKPDDDDYEGKLTPQARPNVLFEAGMAMGHCPNRTILVEFGRLRKFSDISGIHLIRMTNGAQSRVSLVNALKIAGMDVNDRGTDYLDESMINFNLI